MDRKTYFLVAGIIFTLVALFHLLRVLEDWPVMVVDWSVPKWGNVQGEIDRATGRVSLQTQLANSFSLQALP